MSAERTFSAADVGWQAQGRCVGADFDFVPFVEDPGELAAVRSLWCDPCPVRTECLLYALLYREQGYWGGTDTAERRALVRDRSRAKCPCCRSKSVIGTEDRHEICQHCGTSWSGDMRPSLLEEMHT